MFVQIQLFSLEEEMVVKDDVKTTFDQLTDKRSFAGETQVTLYKIEDRQTNMIYFGITNNFDKRIGDHKAGNHTNKDFVEAILNRPDDFDFSEFCVFTDFEYRLKGANSRSHAIESFAIALYNTLNVGYNRTCNFKHDFTDEKFWVDTLPPEILPLYRIADLEQLNRNLGINEHKPAPERKRRSFKKQNIVAKDILKKRILELKALDINMHKYVVKYAGVCRSDLHRFLNGNYNYISVKKALQLVYIIEERLNLVNRFDFEAEYLKAKSFEVIKDQNANDV